MTELRQSIIRLPAGMVDWRFGNPPVMFVATRSAHGRQGRNCQLPGAQGMNMARYSPAATNRALVIMGPKFWKVAPGISTLSAGFFGL